MKHKKLIVLASLLLATIVSWITFSQQPKTLGEDFQGKMEITNLLGEETGEVILEGVYLGGKVNYPNKYWSAPLYSSEETPGYLGDSYAIDKEKSVLSIQMTGREGIEDFQKEIPAKDLESFSQTIDSFNTDLFEEGVQEFFVSIPPASLKEGFSMEDYSFARAELSLPLKREAHFSRRGLFEDILLQTYAVGESLQGTDLNEGKYREFTEELSAFLSSEPEDPISFFEQKKSLGEKALGLKEEYLRQIESRYEKNPEEMEQKKEVFLESMENILTQGEVPTAFFAYEKDLLVFSFEESIFQQTSFGKDFDQENSFLPSFLRVNGDVADAIVDSLYLSYRGQEEQITEGGRLTEEISKSESFILHYKVSLRENLSQDKEVSFDLPQGLDLSTFQPDVEFGDTPNLFTVQVNPTDRKLFVRFKNGAYIGVYDIFLRNIVLENGQVGDNILSFPMGESSLSFTIPAKETDGVLNTTILSGKNLYFETRINQDRGILSSDENVDSFLTLTFPKTYAGFSYIHGMPNEFAIYDATNSETPILLERGRQYKVSYAGDNFIKIRFVRNEIGYSLNGREFLLRYKAGVYGYSGETEGPSSPLGGPTFKKIGLLSKLFIGGEEKASHFAEEKIRAKMYASSTMNYSTEKRAYEGEFIINTRNLYLKDSIIFIGSTSTLQYYGPDYDAIFSDISAQKKVGDSWQDIILQEASEEEIDTLIPTDDLKYYHILIGENKVKLNFGELGTSGENMQYKIRYTMKPVLKDDGKNFMKPIISIYGDRYSIDPQNLSYDPPTIKIEIDNLFKEEDFLLFYPRIKKIFSKVVYDRDIRNKPNFRRDYNGYQDFDAYTQWKVFIDPKGKDIDLSQPFFDEYSAAAPGVSFGLIPNMYRGTSSSEEAIFNQQVQDGTRPPYRIFVFTSNPIEKRRNGSEDNFNRFEPSLMNLGRELSYGTDYTISVAEKGFSLQLNPTTLAEDSAAGRGYMVLADIGTKKIPSSSYYMENKFYQPSFQSKGIGYIDLPISNPGGGSGGGSGGGNQGSSGSIKIEKKLNNQRMFYDMERFGGSDWEVSLSNDNGYGARKVKRHSLVIEETFPEDSLADIVRMDNGEPKLNVSGISNYTVTQFYYPSGKFKGFRIEAPPNALISSSTRVSYTTRENIQYLNEEQRIASFSRSGRWEKIPYISTSTATVKECSYQNNPSSSDPAVSISAEKQGFSSTMKAFVKAPLTTHLYPEFIEDGLFAMKVHFNPGQFLYVDKGKPSLKVKIYEDLSQMEGDSLEIKKVSFENVQTQPEIYEIYDPDGGMSQEQSGWYIGEGDVLSGENLSRYIESYEIKRDPDGRDYIEITLDNSFYEKTKRGQERAGQDVLITIYFKPTVPLRKKEVYFRATLDGMDIDQGIPLSRNIQIAWKPLRKTPGSLNGWYLNWEVQPNGSGIWYDKDWKLGDELNEGHSFIPTEPIEVRYGRRDTVLDPSKYEVIYKGSRDEDRLPSGEYRYMEFRIKPEIPEEEAKTYMDLKIKYRTLITATSGSPDLKNKAFYYVKGHLLDEKETETAEIINISTIQTQAPERPSFAGNIVVKTVDQDNVPLGGAIYKLYKTGPDGNSPMEFAREEAAGDTGIVKFENLPIDEKYVVEQSKRPRTYFRGDPYNGKINVEKPASFDPVREFTWTKEITFRNVKGDSDGDLTILSTAIIEGGSQKFYGKYILYKVNTLPSGEKQKEKIKEETTNWSYYDAQFLLKKPDPNQEYELTFDLEASLKDAYEEVDKSFLFTLNTIEKTGEGDIGYGANLTFKIREIQPEYTFKTEYRPIKGTDSFLEAKDTSEVGPDRLKSIQIIPQDHLEIGDPSWDYKYRLKKIELKASYGSGTLFEEGKSDPSVIIDRSFEIAPGRARRGTATLIYFYEKVPLSLPSGEGTLTVYAYQTPFNLISSAKYDLYYLGEVGSSEEYLYKIETKENTSGTEAIFTGLAKGYKYKVEFRNSLYDVIEPPGDGSIDFDSSLPDVEHGPGEKWNIYREFRVKSVEGTFDYEGNYFCLVNSREQDDYLKSISYVGSSAEYGQILYIASDLAPKTNPANGDIYTLKRISHIDGPDLNGSEQEIWTEAGGRNIDITDEGSDPNSFYAYVIGSQTYLRVFEYEKRSPRPPAVNIVETGTFGTLFFGGAGVLLLGFGIFYKKKKKKKKETSLLTEDLSKKEE